MNPGMTYTMDHDVTKPSAKYATDDYSILRWWARQNTHDAIRRINSQSFSV